MKLRDDERWSDQFPGYIDQGNGRFRKPWIRPNGKHANSYFDIAVCSCCGAEHLQWLRNKKNNKTGTTFCGPKCQSLGRYNIGAEKYKRGKRNAKRSHLLTCKPDHPAARKGYVPTHRLVMEIILGRYLSLDEVVHHINCVPFDNRQENLVLCKNNTEHNSIHASLLDCIEELIDRGYLGFDITAKRYSVKR